MKPSADQFKTVELDKNITLYIPPVCVENPDVFFSILKEHKIGSRAYVVDMETKEETPCVLLSRGDIYICVPLEKCDGENILEFPNFMLTAEQAPYFHVSFYPSRTTTLYDIVHEVVTVFAKKRLQKYRIPDEKVPYLRDQLVDLSILLDAILDEFLNSIQKTNKKEEDQQ